MNSALSPREIQARLRAGASVPEVAAEAGVEVNRIEGFALPVMAERAHMTRMALGASVRRRGDGSGHRRLGEIVRERLQARSLDADTVEWDAWRQNDLKWRLVGLLDDQAASRAAEFVFDPKGRFSIADNGDARWMIGETLPGPQTDPDNENTIDFNDELALVRAISDGPAARGAASGRPGDDVPPHDSQYEGAAHTSELDELYDMLSGVSEDSVRIYLGLEDEESSEPATDRSDGRTANGAPEPLHDSDPTAGSADESEATLADRLSEHPERETSVDAGSLDHDGAVADAAGPTSTTVPADALPRDKERDGIASPADSAPDEPTSEVGTSEHRAPSGTKSGGASKSAAGSTTDVTAGGSSTAPKQDPLVPEVAPSAPKRKPAKKRASIPSWDEIMFGGPTSG